MMVCFVKLGRTTFNQLCFGVLALNRAAFGEVVEFFDDLGTILKVPSSSTTKGPGFLSLTKPGALMHPTKFRENRA